MTLVQLTPLAKARVWSHSTISPFVPTGAVIRQVSGDAGSSVPSGHVTLEAIVPRGGRAEYGLLGIRYDRHSIGMLQLEVPYSEGEGDTWLDSLAKNVDDVRLGLPREYATPILEAASAFGAQRFPPGAIKVTEAAHGLVGSSTDFFRRLTIAALTLLHDAQFDRDKKTLLRGLLVE